MFRVVPPQRILTNSPFRIERVRPEALHDLRRRVLRGGNPALSVHDPRDGDPTSRHFGGFEGQRIVVSASFYQALAPVNPQLNSCQLRYMATDFDVQGRGYGARVLVFGEVELRAIGVEQMWANGRDTALGFYEACGWSVVPGSAHVSHATQLPHQVIFKRLDDDVVT